MSLASVTAQQSSAQAAASGATQTGTNSLLALSSNFNSFLQMLMTQLKNQDPTSPMDANEFTSELVQFSGVEQQIATNNSLTQLIQATQGGEVLQATAMTGKHVTVQSDQLALQNGAGTVNFTAGSAKPVTIAIANAAGQQVYGTTMTPTIGQNSWTWNGQGSNGVPQPDGAYTVAILGDNTAGGSTAIPFTVTGVATGVQNLSSGMQLQLGGLSVPFSAIQSVAN